MTLWQHLENITYHKRTWDKLSDEERKTANGYMLTRFISMEYNYIDVINEIQTLGIPTPYLYNLYVSVIPKQKKFFQYIKKSVKETDGDNLKLMVKVFKISEREAKDYLDNLDKKQIEALKLQVEGIKSKKKKNGSEKTA